LIRNWQDLRGLRCNETNAAGVRQESRVMQRLEVVQGFRALQIRGGGRSVMVHGALARWRISKRTLVHHSCLFRHVQSSVIAARVESSCGGVVIASHDLHDPGWLLLNLERTSPDFGCIAARNQGAANSTPSQTLWEVRIHDQPIHARKAGLR
jgi:hypothetical protein